MLIRQAQIGGLIGDVRVVGDRIAAIEPRLAPEPAEPVIEAAGGALLPGLHDHHIHLNAAAAALGSVRCGPADVGDARGLAQALNAAPGADWLRGVGYHPSVAGEIDRDWLDQHGPQRPVRLQHRGGRMWIVNSLAARLLGPGVPSDGRLIDRDDWLRGRLGATPPDLAAMGAMLARLGVTGVTEVTPRNSLADYHRYAEAGLPQRLLVMGDATLDAAAPIARARRGAVKLHYHDHDLPALDNLAAEVGRAHDAGRAVASHCVTLAELMLTLAAVETVGAHRGDRIEHGGVITPEAADWIAGLGLTVVSQPHFLTERGAAYLADVPTSDHPWLYRLRGLAAAGIPIAAGSDAPFGGLDPWASMAAAVDRPPGFGSEGGLTPEDALALYIGEADAPGTPRRLVVGAVADLCLIDRSWSRARRALGTVKVRATIVGGELAYRSMESTRPQANAS